MITHTVCGNQVKPLVRKRVEYRRRLSWDANNRKIRSIELYGNKYTQLNQKGAGREESFDRDKKDPMGCGYTTQKTSFERRSLPEGMINSLSRMQRSDPILGFRGDLFDIASENRAT